MNDRFDLVFLVRLALARGLAFAPEGDFFRAMPFGCP